MSSRLTIKAPPYNLPPRYNICPTDPVDAVTERDGSRGFVRMRWGLVPSLWPKPLKELKAARFNARAETVAEKPFFRDAFRRTRRRLIPASGSRGASKVASQIRAARSRRGSGGAGGREWRSITAMSAFSS